MDQHSYGCDCCRLENMKENSLQEEGGTAANGTRAPMMMKHASTTIPSHQTHTDWESSTADDETTQEAAVPLSFNTPKSTNCRKQKQDMKDDAIRIRGKTITVVDIADILRSGEADESPNDLIQSIPREAYESILGNSSRLEISWGLLLRSPPVGSNAKNVTSTHTIETTKRNEEVTLEHLIQMRYEKDDIILKYCESLIQGDLNATERLQILPPIFTTSTRVSLREMLQAEHPWIVTKTQNALQLTVVDDRVASLLLLESSPAANPSPETTTPTVPKTSKRKKKKKRKVNTFAFLSARIESLTKKTNSNNRPTRPLQSYMLHPHMT